MEVKNKITKFKLKEDVTWFCSLELQDEKNEFDSEFLKIDRSSITVKKGFKWDGCSPKFRVGDFLIGTPDGKYIEHRFDQGESNFKPMTWRASMLHDALYEYKGQHKLSRRTVDLIFLCILEEAGFKLAKLYWLAVRLFGWIYNNGIKW